MLNVLCGAVYSVTVVEGDVEPELCQLLGDDMGRLLQPWLGAELKGQDWTSAFERASRTALPPERANLVRALGALVGGMAEAERQPFATAVAQLLEETAMAFGSPDPGARHHLRDLLDATSNT